MARRKSHVTLGVSKHSSQASRFIMVETCSDHKATDHSSHFECPSYPATAPDSEPDGNERQKNFSASNFSNLPPLSPVGECELKVNSPMSEITAYPEYANKK